MSKTDKEILQEARALVAKGWTTRALARNAKGEHVSVHGESASCFCLMGAFIRARGPIGSGGGGAMEALRKVVRLYGYSGVMDANDDTGSLAAILDYFDEALVLLPKEEASS